MARIAFFTTTGNPINVQIIGISGGGQKSIPPNQIIDLDPLWGQVSTVIDPENREHTTPIPNGTPLRSHEPNFHYSSLWASDSGLVVIMDSSIIHGGLTLQ